MKRDLRGKRVLITGASGGIGRSLAEGAAARGAAVILAARSTDKVHELASNLTAGGARAIAAVADVTADSDRRRLLDIAVQQLGGLDVLVNNAGVASFGHFATSNERVLRDIMEVNFFAPAELIREAIPILSQGAQPAIVNIASMCGRRGMPAWPEYSASKFALCGLTEALRGEMARFDIDVLLMLPGLTRSELPQHLLRNEGRMKIGFDDGMDPAAVADAVLRGLERNQAETVLGSDARWLLRLEKFVPRLLDRLITRRVKKLYVE
jgi:short-subunit dehydrogenase